MVNNKKTIKDLQQGLQKFKEDAVKKGWEEDEVQEKISEVFENFPWYKFNPPKRSLMSKLGTIFLYSFIIYLAYSAVLERNRRLKKRVDDFFFDNQYSYQQQRFLRFVTLPLFKLYDVSLFHNEECLVKNPFAAKVEMSCDFCEGLDSIPTLHVDSVDVKSMIQGGEPFIVRDVPGYYNTSIGFADFQNMFEKNAQELDDAICKVWLTKAFYKVSDYFQMTEEEVLQKKISIGWRNCGTYGTRFYRKLVSRPPFISKDSEVFLEKEVYIVQKNQNVSVPRMEGEVYYIAQLQGESKFVMSIPSDCHYNCTSEPLEATIKKGELAVFTNGAWVTSFKSTSEGLSIVYISSFT